MKFAAAIEYDGAPFSGWQRQIGQSTVQGALETALTRVADHPVDVVTAGRTDAGVNATSQIVHFETSAERPDHGWLRGTNTHLPDAVRVLWVQAVDDDFHARFLASARHYRYVLLNRSAGTALYRHLATVDHRPLDEQRMDEAAQALVGTHDFSAFRAAGCQAKSPVRDVRELRIHRRGDWLWMDVHANAFLHHMVRNLVGVLGAIGAGEKPVDWAREVLVGRDRRHGGVTAPPQGLYLVRVDYPERFALPPAPPPPRFW